ncbi:MAG: hypothetical protein QG602_1624 [Verrucomicrobiota bacterium]|nr:hypothetical protein [Verrucomicrobiota bacterium]
MALVLQPMTATIFAEWRRRTVPDYAAAKVANGDWSEDTAPALAEENLKRLLPEGLASPGHYFYLVTEASDARVVGNLWFARQGADAYLYDLHIRGEFRGRGYGREAMLLLETAAAALGLRRIGLHVFGQNHIARSLYGSLGYETTDLTMRKQLSQPA